MVRLDPRSLSKFPFKIFDLNVHTFVFHMWSDATPFHPSGVVSHRVYSWFAWQFHQDTWILDA